MDTTALGPMLAAICILFYLAPALVAHQRKHRSRVAITLLCLLVGWTGFGWVAAMVWAGTGNVDGAPLSAQQKIERDLYGHMWSQAHLAVAKEMGLRTVHDKVFFDSVSQYREFDHRVAMRLFVTL